MSDLDARINEHFPGYVVRKDLVKAVKGNAIVPTYVLEYLHCKTACKSFQIPGVNSVQ
jgi:ATP-dependent Lon protease